MGISLEQNIINSIVRYPTLFRQNNWENSRLLVLHHMFMVGGNGLEWTKDGILFSKYEKDIRKHKLPLNYFEMNLWKFELSFNMVKDFRIAFKKEFPKAYFFINYSKERIKSVSTTIEANKETALRYRKEFASMEEKKFISLIPNFIDEARSGRKGERIFSESGGPYPLSEYAGLVEMLNEKTNSFQEIISPLIVPEDWRKGAIDIAQEALDYYLNPKLIGNHIYHFNSKIESKTTSLAERKKFWKKFLAKEIKTLRAFLKKFKNK